jgi:hypothetical protein
MFLAADKSAATLATFRVKMSPFIRFTKKRQYLNFSIG